MYHLLAERYHRHLPGVELGAEHASRLAAGNLPSRSLTGAVSEHIKSYCGYHSLLTTTYALVAKGKGTTCYPTCDLWLGAYLLPTNCLLTIYY